MKRTNEMQGRRLPDVDVHEGATNVFHRMQPGDYVKVLKYPPPLSTSNLTGDVWYAMTPNGLDANLAAHTVREEDDGSISVKPGDGSSNSILVTGAPGESWHGYIKRGLWWSLA